MTCQCRKGATCAEHLEQADLTLTAGPEREEGHRIWVLDQDEEISVAELLDQMVDEYAALGMMSYHGGPAGLWFADLTKDDVEGIRQRLRAVGTRLGRIAIAVEEVAPDSVKPYLRAVLDGASAELLQAIAEERCNGCELPRKQWGPVCSGVTVGDFTHYHSPEYWRRRLA